MIPYQPHDEQGEPDQIAALLHRWVLSKRDRTGSARTEAEYGHVLSRLRRDLQHRGLDLDSDPHQLAAFIEEWVRVLKKSTRKSVSPRTRNQRLSTISSFYQFAIRQGVWDANPIKLLDYSKVEQYGSAEPMDQRVILRVLKEIDLALPIGRRDLALLMIAFTTGRRASELAHLMIRDLMIAGDDIRIHWHTKGGKEITDPLEPPAAQALIGWLTSWYGPEWRKERDAPVWARVEGDQHQVGQQLSYHGIRLIFIRRFGPHASKVHASRHSFAQVFLKGGGSLIELMHRLGHSNLNTTYIYARAIGQGDGAERTEVGKLLHMEEVLSQEGE